jgi:hypothetical protein
VLKRSAPQHYKNGDRSDIVIFLLGIGRKNQGYRQNLGWGQVECRISEELPRIAQRHGRGRAGYRETSLGFVKGQKPTDISLSQTLPPFLNSRIQGMGSLETASRFDNRERQRYSISGAKTARPDGGISAALPMNEVPLTIAATQPCARKPGRS